MSTVKWTAPWIDLPEATKARSPTNPADAVSQDLIFGGGSLLILYENSCYNILQPLILLNIEIRKS